MSHLGKISSCFPARVQALLKAVPVYEQPEQVHRAQLLSATNILSYGHVCNSELVEIQIQLYCIVLPCLCTSLSMSLSLPLPAVQRNTLLITFARRWGCFKSSVKKFTNGL